MRKHLALLLAGCLAFSVAASAGPQPGVNSPYNPVWSIPIDSIKYTYSVSMNNLVVAGSPTTYWNLCGTASATVRLTRVVISGRQTAVAAADFQLIKTSTAATGGTIASAAPFSSAAIVGVPYDSGFPAGTAKVTAWTANPTVGTAVGVIFSGQVYLGNLTTGVSGPPAVIDFGSRPSSAPVLRGTAQCIELSGAVGTGPGSGNLMDITFEWTEE